MAWSAKFGSPIDIGDGVRLSTLREAGTYLAEKFGNVLESVSLVGAVEDLMAAADSGAKADIEQAERQVRLFLSAPGSVRQSVSKITPYDLVRGSIERERKKTASRVAAKKSGSRFKGKALKS